MPLNAGIFDSTYITGEVNGLPVPNRAVGSEFLARQMMGILSDGLIRTGDDAMQVSLAGALNLSVSPGDIWVRGRFAYTDAAQTMALPQSEFARTVHIVARLILITPEMQNIVLDYVTDVTQPDRSDTIWELWLARLDIPANTLVLQPQMLTDLRSDRTYCGWIYAPFATTPWETVPQDIRDGFIRLTTAPGGTADSFVAVAGDGTGVIGDNITVVFNPPVNCNAGATLSINGEAPAPIYTTDGNAVKVNGMVANTPVLLTRLGGRYFFRGAGGGELMVASGSFAPPANTTTMTVTGLDFWPKTIAVGPILYVPGSPVNNSYITQYMAMYNEVNALLVQTARSNNTAVPVPSSATFDGGFNVYAPNYYHFQANYPHLWYATGV